MTQQKPGGKCLKHMTLKVKASKWIIKISARFCK